MNKENCTKGPVTAKPFLTPREDEDPMMIYKVEGGDLQARFDALTVDENGDYDQDQVDALHAENEANAELIAEAFNVLHETGMTPRELADTLIYLEGKLGSLCDTMPDQDWADTDATAVDSDLSRCRHIIDDMQAKLEEHQPVTPA
jgi:hypothetical protein